MNAYESRLKQIIHDAAYDAGVPFRSISDTVKGLLDSLNDDDEVCDIAAKTLAYLCVENGKYNNFSLGIKAVFVFLAESHDASEQPYNLKDVRACQTALSNVMEANCTVGKLRSWVNEWYR